MADRKVELSGDAERDFAAIVEWSAEHFGARQAQIYSQTLIAAITALATSQEPKDSRARDDVLAGLRSLHVARGKRRGRHFIIYQPRKGAVLIVRILHDSMDIARHITPGDKEK